MKRIYLLALLAIVALQGLCATTFTVGSLNYEVVTAPSGTTRGTVVCTGLTSSAKSSTIELVVPGAVSNGSDNYYVTAIEAMAFEDCSKIIIAVIDHGITDIRQHAFRRCTSLGSVRIPSSVTNIGQGAFASCSSLNNVYLASLNPAGITSLPGSFPASTTATLYVPHGANTADYRQMRACASTYFPTIENSSNPFDFYLSSQGYFVVTKEATTTTMGEVMINGYVGTGTLKPSASVLHNSKMYAITAIADSAFRGDTRVQTIDLSEATNLTSMGRSMAENCTNLTSVTMTRGDIPMFAFYGCTALTTVNIDGVTGLYNQCFNKCSSLSGTFNIPASVTTVKYGAFYDCPLITRLDVDASSKYLSSIDGVLYNKSQTQLLRVPAGYTKTTLSIPSTVTTLNDGSIANCTKLQYFSVPYGVKTVGSNAFYGCTSLTRLDIPSSVTTMYGSAVGGCSSLNNLYVNTNHVPINSYFNFTPANCNLYVQRGMVDAFKAAGWTGFKNYNNGGTVAADYFDDDLAYTVTSTASATINGTTYAGRAKVVHGRGTGYIEGDVTIPASITLAGSKQFAVTKVDTTAFGANDNYAIKGCANVDSVLYQAFYYEPITSIELPSVSYIGDQAFAHSELTTATLGTKSTFIGANAFTSSALKELVAPNVIRYNSQFFGQNASDCMLYVGIGGIAALNNSAASWTFNNNGKCNEHLSVCFIAESSHLNLGAVVPLDLRSVPGYPYTVTDVASDGTLSTRYTNYVNAGEGVMLFYLAIGNLCKIDRWTNPTTTPTNLLKAVTTASTKMLTSGYTWDTTNNRFNKVTSTTRVPSGYCWLDLSGTASYYYIDFLPGSTTKGDVNGDGIVDITDVNMVINMVLGKVEKSSAADIDGSGDVDITDVNAVINIMLGK